MDCRGWLIARGYLTAAGDLCNNAASMVTAGVTDSTQLMLYTLLAAFAACYLPNLGLRWMAARRKREIFESFPDAADLMLVCVEAGMGLDAALGKVTEEIRLQSEALAQELHWTNLGMRAGSTREVWLRRGAGGAVVAWAAAGLGQPALRRSRPGPGA